MTDISDMGGENLHGGREDEDSPVDSEDEEQDDVDKGWAWMICFASFLTNFILDGVLFSFGVILLKLLEHYESSKSKTAWVGSALLGLSIAMGPVVSLLLEYYSCRQVMILGSLISTSGFILSVFAPNIETLIFTYGVIGGAGFGLCFVTAILAVGLHFNKKRALATGIAMSGSGVGTFAISYLTERLLDWYGLHGTMLIIAGLVLNCCVCGGLMRPLVKRNSPLFLCCMGSSHSNLQRASSDSSILDIEIQVSEDQEGGNQTILQTNLLQQTKLNPLQKLILDDKKMRLFHSNEHVAPPVDVSHRQYKSELHLHKHHHIHHTTDPLTKVLGLPSRRKDLFYSGSIYNLPEYKQGHNMNTFLKSMISLTSSEEKLRSHRNYPTKHSHGTMSAFIEDHKDLFTDKLFIMLLFIMTAWTGHATVLTYVPDLAVSKGVSKTNAALLVSSVGVSNIIGRLFSGWLTNRPSVDSLVVYTSAILLAGLTSAVFPLCTTFVTFVVCSCVFGLCMAACVSLRTVVLADVLGISKLTKAFGVVAFLQGGAFTVGPPISGALYDTTLSFLPLFLLVAVMYLVSGCVCAMVRPVQKRLCCFKCGQIGVREEKIPSDDSHSTQSFTIQEC